MRYEVCFIDRLLGKPRRKRWLFGGLIGSHEVLTTLSVGRWLWNGVQNKGCELIGLNFESQSVSSRFFSFMVPDDFHIQYRQKYIPHITALQTPEMIAQEEETGISPNANEADGTIIAT